VRKPFIICVDDEMIILSTLVEEIQYILGKTFEYEIAQSGSEALELVQDLLDDNETIAIVFSDFCMPGMAGLELLPAVHDLSPQTRCILLTGMDQCDLDIDAETKSKIFGYIPKPWSEDILRKMLQQALPITVK
jgi:DNA-binding NtrC family response regulator